MNKRFIKVFVVALIYILFLSKVKYSFSDNLTYLKVALNYGSASVKNIELESDSGFEVGNLSSDNQFTSLNKINTNKIVVSREENNIKVSGESGNQIMNLPFSNGWIEINSLGKNIKIGSKSYHGSALLNIKNSGSGINVINYVELEQYLYGVIPKEVSPTWNIEALKAQTLAARTYAVANKGKYIKKYGFDITNDTLSQVYGGCLVEDTRSNKAVDDTRGQYIYYKDKLIDAVFFSCSGGRTDDAENVWGSAIPYLKSVDDSFEPKNISKANWNKSYTSTEISNILTKNGVNIGDIVDVKANVAPSGRVLTMTFIGTSGEKILARSKFMTIFSLDSNNFIIQKSSKDNTDNNINTSSSNNEDVDSSSVDYKGTKVYVASSKGTYELKNIDACIQSKNGVIKNKIYGKTIKGNGDLAKNITAPQETNTKVDTTESTFSIQGKGWGHGVGMSQWGAKGMADAGKNYIEILEHYYTGVQIK